MMVKKEKRKINEDQFGKLILKCWTVIRSGSFTTLAQKENKYKGSNTPHQGA